MLPLLSMCLLLCALLFCLIIIPSLPSCLLTPSSSPSPPPSPPPQCYICAPKGSKSMAALLTSHHFSTMGRFPAYYELLNGKTLDAVLWANALHGYSLAQYKPSKQQLAALTDKATIEDTLANLTDPALPSMRVRPMPKWLRDCLLQFGLPLFIVFLLFIVSYGLAVLGPLKGISNIGAKR